MPKRINLLIISLIIISAILPAQETNSVSESRKQNIRKLLDYRFKGGYYTFEKMFNNNVSYPVELTGNCFMGIVIASFTVDCSGEFTEFSFKNPIHPSINKAVTDFFDLTFGLWNECNDDKYTKFEIPIQFRIVDAETNMTDALLICVGESPGYVCNGDNYYYKKAKKLLEKEKGKKAMDYINVLIVRDPYNLEYYDMKKEALSFMK